MFEILSFVTGMITFVFGYSVYTEYAEHERIDIKNLLLFFLFFILSVWLYNLGDIPNYKHNLHIPA